MANIKMKDPAHPGLLIKECLEGLHISIEKGAEALGITLERLNRVVTTQSAVTPELAVRLEMVLGSTADTWMRMQINYDLDKLREETRFNSLKRLEEPALNKGKP